MMAALRKQLKQGPRAIPPCGAALALARIHERALATLELFNSKNGLIKLAEFFTEALIPIVETHRVTKAASDPGVILFYPR
jgi:hypothetical protein